VNVAGAGLLGWVAVRLPERLPPSTYRRPLLGTGFCGGLTTFSTMQVEAVRLARGDRMGVAAAYVAVSLLAGLLVAALAMRVARRARWRA
jgi:CrcB protein